MTADGSGRDRPRLFVAVWPPPATVDALRALPRPTGPWRWTTAAQWHVTLRYLGPTDPGSTAALLDGLAVAAAAVPAPRAVLGPCTVQQGRRLLVVAVAGLDGLAEVVRDATVGAVPEGGRPRPFRGHLTLARARGRDRLPSDLAGTPVHDAWPVTEVALVRSHLHPTGARYEVLGTARTAPAG